MNRFVAFAIVCSAAILFLLVAYSKISEDGLIRRGLTSSSSTKDSLLDRNLEENLHATPPNLPIVRSKAEVFTDESSSDISSSVDEGIIDIPNARNIIKEERTKKENDDKPILIIVLARMRTGSSLVGEIFNQNPSIFYIFEPLHAVDTFIRHHAAAEVRRQGISVSLLSMLAKCQFTPEFLDSLSRWPLGKSKSSGLLPICKTTDGCRHASHHLMEERCRSFGGRMGMKTIRADLNMLKSLVEKDNINLKVIHLVRDPRGTANSRRTYYGERRSKQIMPKKGKLEIKKVPNFSLKSLGLLEEHPHFHINTVFKYCKWMSDNIPLAKSRPPWLQNRYKLVRYEDLALDPVRVTQEIYEFVGLTMPPNIQEWVLNNTNENNRQNSSRFGVQKNSKEVMQSWRHSLPYEEVVQVQEICGTAMVLGGYREVQRPEDLTDTSFDTIEPLTGWL